MALAGCSSDSYEGWADPQKSDPEDAKNVTLSITNAPDINFGTLASDSVQIFAPVVTATNATVETNSYTVTLYNADKSASATITADADGRVLASEFKSDIETLYGKAPATRNVQMDITGYAATVDNVTIKNTGTAEASVTVVAPFIDEGGYYLVGDMFGSADGSVSGWSKEGAQAFKHLGSGDVYDAPQFQITFQTTKADQYWKIIPANNYNGDFWKNGDQGVVGVVTDGDTSLSGNLATAENGPGAGKIADAGIYRMTINMMDYTYSIEKLNFAEYIYTVGNIGTTSWSESFPLYGANFDGKYTGYYYIHGAFKFKPNADNYNDDWGQDPNGATGTLVQEGEQDCPSPGDGFYKIDVDLSAMTYTTTAITAMGIVGEATVSDDKWNTDQDMTYNTEEGCWEISNLTLTDGNIKFRANHGWAINWGGSLDNLTQDGANIDVTAGTYDIKLYVSYAGNCHATMTKK